MVMKNRYTKKELNLLSENYISKSLDKDVDAFLFHLANVMGFSSVYIVKFLNNAEQDKIDTILNLVKLIKHIQSPEILRQNSVAIQVSDAIKNYIQDEKEISSNGETESETD